MSEASPHNAEWLHQYVNSIHQLKLLAFSLHSLFVTFTLSSFRKWMVLDIDNVTKMTNGEECSLGFGRALWMQKGRFSLLALPLTCSIC